MFDVMVTAMHVIPRVETTLYTGWSSSKTANFLQPIVLDNIVNAYKGKVTAAASIALAV